MNDEWDKNAKYESRSIKGAVRKIETRHPVGAARAKQIHRVASIAISMIETCRLFLSFRKSSDCGRYKVAGRSCARSQQIYFRGANRRCCRTAQSQNASSFNLPAIPSIPSCLASFDIAKAAWWNIFRRGLKL